MELKLRYFCLRHSRTLRSNCTFMELKLESGVLLELAGGSSNCTFMELKLRNRLPAKVGEGF